MQQLCTATHGGGSGKGSGFQSPAGVQSKCSGGESQGAAGGASREFTPAEIEEDAEAACGQGTEHGLVQHMHQIDGHDGAPTNTWAIKTPMAMNISSMMTKMARAPPMAGCPSMMSD